MLYSPGGALLRIRSTVRFFLLSASFLLAPGFAGTKEKMQPRAMRFGGSVQLEEFRLLAVSESNSADLDNFGLPMDGWT